MPMCKSPGYEKGAIGMFRARVRPEDENTIPEGAADGDA